ncbi:MULTISPECIES: flagellar hook-length control protein FliK [Paenibacillus]|jgi:flagellar hook-length control protein FliK|uniref:flagellar hook-length control protein FliK n=1 Tax=Paenibacillus TaxID=44249 RepID=UPI00048F8C41|nr:MULTISPECIES: flagellar hook-length control protein FliK [Paenibacillus]
MNSSISQINASKTGTVNSLWYGSAGKAETGQAAALSFDQKLLAMLLGNAQPQEGQASAQMISLAGLPSGTEGTSSEATENTLVATIEGLLEQLSKLDDALQADPALFSLLQGWLQSVQPLLQQAGLSDNASLGAEGDNALPVLAQQPETMRFAVQDTLVQLLAVAESNGGAAKLTASAQGQAVTMLDSLQQVLDAISDSAEAKSNGGKGTEATGLQPRTFTTDPGATASQQGRAGQNGDMLNRGDARAVQSSSQSSNSAAFRVNDLAFEADPAVDGGTSEAKVHEDPVQTGQVVTAGQLALRDSGIKSVKHVAKPVPVENFAKEMSGFLVNKLEIVNLKGVSEARISLYPEHLGQVDVRITMQNGQLTAQFMTEHAFAKESLEQQMAQLRSALQSQGLQVNKLEVTQNTSLSSHMYHDGRQSGGGTGQQQSEKRRPVTEDETLAIHDLNEEWNEWVAEVRAKEQSYGSSFVARA